MASAITVSRGIDVARVVGAGLQRVVVQQSTPFFPVRSFTKYVWVQFLIQERIVTEPIS